MCIVGLIEMLLRIVEIFLVLFNKDINLEL